MGRKKPEQPKVPIAETTEQDVRRVRLDITPEIHKKLRLAAAQDEKSMAEFARDALIFVLSQREKAK